MTGGVKLHDVFNKKNPAERIGYVVQQYKAKKAKPPTLWNAREGQTDLTISEDQATRRAGARCPNDVLQGKIPCKPNKEYAECDEGLQTFFTNHSNKTRTCVEIVYYDFRTIFL
jgi:hypothetical protein